MTRFWKLNYFCGNIQKSETLRKESFSVKNELTSASSKKKYNELKKKHGTKRGGRLSSRKGLFKKISEMSLIITLSIDDLRFQGSF